MKKVYNGFFSHRLNIIQELVHQKNTIRQIIRIGLVIYIERRGSDEKGREIEEITR